MSTSTSLLSYIHCLPSYDELSDIASTVQAYTSIHFENEEWIKIRFMLMFYSCIIFIWTIVDSIFSDRTLFYFIYATHWILLLSVMLYLICSYVITLVIYERISLTEDSHHPASIYNKKGAHFEDIPLEKGTKHIPSLCELGLFNWNRFIVFLQNASLAPCIVFPLIFWFVIYPNIDSNHSFYDVLLELHIHAIIPILILFDFIFSSRSAQYIDLYQPLMIGVVYCLWTYSVSIDIDDRNASFLYRKYYHFEVNQYTLWFILNLTSLCAVHLIFCFLKSKLLSKHFVPIKLSSNHIVVIDKNGNIIDSKTQNQQYGDIESIKPKKSDKKKKKKQKKKKEKKLQKTVTQKPQNADNDNEDAPNSIKQGFRNLIAIIESNKNESSRTEARCADYALTATDSMSDDHDDEDVDEDEDEVGVDDSNNDNNNIMQQIQFDRFYSLKNQNDWITSSDDGKFNALKTKSLQTLLNLSKKLHPISMAQNKKYNIKLESEYEETSGCEDESAVGLKSGLYKI